MVRAMQAVTPTGVSAAWGGAGLIRDPADVSRLIAHATSKAARRERTAEMRQPVRQLSAAASHEPDATETLPLAPELQELTSLNWPGGVRRGTTVPVTGSTSLLFALLAEPMARGSWAAIVGMPDLGAAVTGKYNGNQPVHRDFLLGRMLDDRLARPR